MNGDSPHWEMDDGKWLHRPPLVVFVNTMLRWFQPNIERKWVIYTRCLEDGTDHRPPTVVGYGFGRVLHLPE